MAKESLTARQKVHFVNLDTLEERAVQFNPTELTHSASAEYTRFQAVGMTYQPVQYGQTSNREYSLTLPFKVESPAERADVDATIAFLRSLLYPAEPGAAPPDCVFVWPNYVGATVKVLAVSERAIQFNAQGWPTRVEVELTLLAVRSTPLLQADVRNRGLME